MDWTDLLGRKFINGKTCSALGGDGLKQTQPGMPTVLHLLFGTA